MREVEPGARGVCHTCEGEIYLSQAPRSVGAKLRWIHVHPERVESFGHSAELKTQRIGR